MVTKEKNIEPGTRQSGILEREINWVARVMLARLKSLFEEKGPEIDFKALQPPDLVNSDSHYAGFVTSLKLSYPERLTLALSIMPLVRPSMLADFAEKGKEVPELGLVRGKGKSVFYPTIRTALFLLGGLEIERVLYLYEMFSDEHFFVRRQVLNIGREAQNVDLLLQQLQISREYFYLFATGRELKPSFSMDFPAKRVKTDQDWDDLVLNEKSRIELEEMKIWLLHRHALMEDWGMRKKLKPGYKSLFYGPPGTGKTFTAMLLGKATGRDVYRIDLSQLISKYIGETEKNLSKIFDQAEHKEWILLFDEADAVFGKRGKVNDARDRYANQEVSYLLQRVEEFDGLVILSSNLKSNIDEAFSRRFQSMVYFPMPDARQRLALWRKAFPKPAKTDPKMRLEEIARKYELSGGGIMNVMRYAALMALHSGTGMIMRNHILDGIKREYHKEGRSL